MDFIKKKKIRSWAKEFIGNYNIYYPETEEEVKKIISSNQNIIPSGGYRSYGDSAISDQIINSKKFNRIISFDEDNGILKAQSGVNIKELLNFLIPKGWFLKVTPGTKYATLGGCVASDVHGKEHHKEGCFSECVKRIKLIINNEKILVFSQKDFPDLFNATCGGMGLTGFISEVEIQCKKIESSQIKYQKKLNKSLEEVFLCFEKFENYNYSVAWLDTIKKKDNYRSVFIFGKFFDNFKFLTSNKNKIPVLFNIKIINNITILFFNYLYFFWNSITKKSGITDYDSFFYPLDKIKNWHRLYGKKGFVQYQFIIPKNESREAILEILEYMNKNYFYSSLAVLKLHGKNNNNFLSFPLSGYSLAMDFHINDKTYFHLEKIDKIVLKYNGKIYLTKDSRLEKNSFNKIYPDYNKILQIRKKFRAINFSSNQSKRLGINE